jgi:hypothetical protein
MSTTPTPRRVRERSGAVAAPTTPFDRKDAKRARREEQLAVRERIERAERRRKQLILAAAAVASIAGLVALGWWLFGPRSGPQVQNIPIQGQTHIPRNGSHPPYNSVPPTSGWHYGDAVAPWGVSPEPIAAEVFVHNLEHGGIVIHYDCPSGCDEMRTRLENIVRSFPSKVLIAPYPGMFEQTQRPIAVTAWGRLAYLDQVDEPFIRDFVRRFKDRGPELVPD